MNFRMLLAGLALACSPIIAQPIGTPDVDDIEYPDDEEHSQEEIELGKVLFFDKRLSVNDEMSCATCHNPDLGFGDGMALGRGTMGNTLGRNTPHIYNLAWSVAFFWDGRASTLEEQAIAPIEAPGEMNMQIGELIPKLKKVPYYAETFEKVYPGSGLTKENLGRAIAAFERSIVVDDTPFDRFMAGDQNAMSPAAIRGMAIYQGKAACTDCHSGPNFTDDSFHNIGIAKSDRGRAAIVDGATMEGAFKTPGLRNVLFTAPYMHDGSLGSLEEVIRHYNEIDPAKDKSLSPTVKNIDLTEAEIFDLLAFLGALNQPLRIERPVIP
jgi:cytochrome c peroxidase